jgi:hypothetical protein
MAPVPKHAEDDVDEHDGVDDQKDKDRKVEPDELIKLSIEEAAPEITALLFPCYVYT